MSRVISKKRNTQIDPKYKSAQIAKLINYIMERGKKSIAQKIVYQALEDLEKKTKTPAPSALARAFDNIAPILEVRSRRIGGANYQVPIEVSEKRKETLAMRWIIEFSKKRKGAPMWQRLSTELFDAYQNQGAAIKRREDTHKMAEANRAFAHFARM
jgi:small subunit ribosomal protein S7